MKKSTVTVRIPEYYRRFHCIGTECSDNCCHGWPIDIDKQHYLQYKAEKNPEFAQICGKNVRRIKKDATQQRYARMALDEEGRCGFQDRDGGCRIVRLLGESCLSNTCTIYPRRKNVFCSDSWELSLAMSCEEAVRIGVLAPEEITFVTETMTFSENDPLFAAVPTGIGPKGQSAEPPSWGASLRTVCISLMQMRQFRVSERIAAIFMLLRRLDKQIAVGQETRIPLETIRFLQSIEQGGLTGFLDSLNYSQDACLAALRIPIGHLIAGRQSDVSRQFLSFLTPYLEWDSQGNLCASRAAAQALLEQMHHRKPEIEEHAVWMENYFVNYLYSSLFPFLYRSDGYSFEEQGLLLIQQYALLNCLLSTVPEQQDQETRFVKAMVHTARLSQHGDFPGDLRSLIQALHIRDNAHLLCLLK